jgi:hypothetical protein
LRGDGTAAGCGGVRRIGALHVEGIAFCWAMVLLQDAVMIDVLVERRGAAARAQ